MYASAHVERCHVIYSCWKMPVETSFLTQHIPPSHSIHMCLWYFHLVHHTRNSPHDTWHSILRKCNKWHHVICSPSPESIHVLIPWEEGLTYEFLLQEDLSPPPGRLLSFLPSSSPVVSNPSWNPVPVTMSLTTGILIRGSGCGLCGFIGNVKHIMICVFYYHSRINVVQSNRLFNLKIFNSYTCV
jgi:hypothetical protein